MRGCAAFSRLLAEKGEYGHAAHADADLCDAPEFLEVNIFRPPQILGWTEIQGEW